MTLKKVEQQILKAHGEVLEAMFNRRIDELKEKVIDNEPEDGEKIRGKYEEIKDWRKIIRDLTKPQTQKEQDKGI